MIYFFVEILMYTCMTIGLFYFLNRTKFSILSLTILLFSINIYTILLYRGDSFIIGLLVTILIVLIKSFYEYIFTRKQAYSESVFIREGIVNFHELVKNNYSYDQLIKYLKKRKIMLDEVEYCIKNDRDLLIIKKDKIRYPISLIIEGNIMENNLLSIKKDKMWLELELNNHDLLKENIEYAYYHRNKLYFITNV